MCPGPEVAGTVAPALRPRRVRTLRLAGEAGSPPFVSAASGLVAAGDLLYVIADDELHLAVFRGRGSRPGGRVPLLAGRLPAARPARKARKADFEVLVRLPRFHGLAHGGLLALGSGSRPRRRRAVLLPLDRQGRIAGPARELDAVAFYRRLAAAFGELNLEGAAVSGDRLWVLNRGHPRHGGSASAWLDIARVVEAGGALGAPRARVHRHELGSVDGVPLGFTDAASLPGGALLFAAVAERAADSYRDGPCLGAAVGILGPDGATGPIRRLEPALKVEGIALVPASAGRRILLVTDADDPAVPAGLYTVERRALRARVAGKTAGIVAR